MKPWHGYLALSLAVIACVAGYARNGGVGCVVVAGAVVAFGIFARSKTNEEKR